MQQIEKTVEWVQLVGMAAVPVLFLLKSCFVVAGVVV